jgi:hypothetical protein
MKKTKSATITLWVSLVMLALLSLITFSPNTTYAEQPPPPCHPNPNAAQDVAAVSGRGDIVNLPDLLHHARHPQGLGQRASRIRTDQHFVDLPWKQAIPWAKFPITRAKKGGSHFWLPLYN